MNTKEDPFLFCVLFKPLAELINDKVAVEKDAAKKLIFEKFLTLLVYFYLAGLDSLRSLITCLKTEAHICQINLSLVGLSTIHDAFHRYQAALFQKLYLKLLNKLPVFQIEEFKELGRFVVIDGSFFAMAISEIWAEFRKNARSLKLHLSFSLEQMIPTCFLVTAGKFDERKAFAKLIEKGITYIADRGYLSFDLFKNLVDKQAYFIIRVRKNLDYQPKTPLAVELIEAVKYIFFQVTDELVQFGADKHEQTYRRISFRTAKTLFVIVTNRLDLTTFDIIRLYALRWQIELFFRFFKRTLNAIHLLNHDSNGVTIQFYVILITHLLLMHYKQKQWQQSLFANQRISGAVPLSKYLSEEEFVKSVGQQIPAYCKIRKQEMQAIKNSLFKSAQLAFDFY